MVSSALLVAMLVYMSPAVACPVDVAGAASEAWLEAARALDEIDAAESDCAGIRLVVEGASARLTYATRDGGEAVRVLESPDELAATIAALGARAPVTQRALIPVVFIREPVTITRPIITIQAGLRSAEGQLLSPALRALVALNEGTLELGVAGEWIMRYSGTQNGTSFTGSEAAASVVAGVREPFAGVSMIAGGRLTLGMYFQHTRVAPMLDDARSWVGEARLGAFTGVVWPMSEAIRLRGELGADFTPYAASASSVPVPKPGQMFEPFLKAQAPVWTLALLLGVELGSP